jgi:tRNA(Ile)-lysidine synthase
MIRRVHATVLKFGMLRRGDHVLVAVSGGADSVALLHVLRRLERRWELRLSAAHLNHGLRGAESDEDEAFVLRLGKELGVPVVSERWERPPAGNLEQAARRARYAFLRRAAASAGATRIAVGHTRDDQAETVLLRILRGSGSLGLVGIHPVVDDLIVRPLIEISRAEIERYLTASGVPWRSDSSNSDLRYRRNRIRHELLPLLRDGYNPRIDEVLAREAAVARDTAGYLEEAARVAYEEMRRDAVGGVALDVPSLLRLHPALRREAVRLALRECRGSLRGIDAAHVEAALLLANDAAWLRHAATQGGLLDA